MSPWLFALLFAAPSTVELRPAQIPSVEEGASIAKPGEKAKGYSARIAGASLLFVDLEGDGALDALQLPKNRVLLPVRSRVVLGDKEVSLRIDGIRSVTFEARKLSFGKGMKRIWTDLNRARQRSGLHPVSWHERTKVPCALHARYMQRWPEVAEAAPETPGWDAYSAAGRKMGAAGITLRTTSGKAIARCLSSYRARLLLMDPHLWSLCGAVSKNGKVVVLDPVTGHRAALGREESPPEAVRWPLAYPAPESTVKGAFMGHAVETRGRTLGMPISLQLGPRARAGFELLETSLVAETSGRKLDFKECYPGAPFPQLQSAYNAVGLIPERKLGAGWYRVRIRYRLGGQDRERTWRFRVQ